MKVSAAILLLLTGALTVGWSTEHRSAAPLAERGAAQSANHDGDIDGMRHTTLPHAIHASIAEKQAKRKQGFNCISTCSAYESTINQYFTDVAAASAAHATDNVYSVATQYSGIQYDVTFDANANTNVDGTPYPATHACHDGYDKYCVTDSQLQAEIKKVIAARGWPTHSNTALYFIFTPANVGVCEYAGEASDTNSCTTNAFCAYHNWTASHSFIYAVEPDAAAAYEGACTPEDAFHHAQTPAGNGADATINTISHEHNEAITDPYGDAWYSNDQTSNYPENGDLCAYDFGTPLGGAAGAQYNQVINTHPYYLQLEYSNAANSGAGGCVPYLGGPVTAADPLDGVGPLVHQTDTGAVMTTNTVYAIYWVPVKPANSVPPAISGAAKVGQKLKAANGKWSSATKFTYRWFRCSPGGGSCKTIARATGRSYTPAAADAHHRLEVRVTGTNMAGSRSARSAPTGTVRS